MAVNFTFGQNLSNTLGQTLDRQQQAAQLQRLIERDMFQREISRMAQRMNQKRFDLQKRKFEEELVADALDRERQSELDELNRRREEATIDNIKSLVEQRGRQDPLDKEMKQAQIDNIRSLIESRKQGQPGQDRSGSAAITLLQNMAPETREVVGAVIEAENEFMQARESFDNAETEADKKFFRKEMERARNKMATSMKRAESVTDIVNDINKKLGLDVDMGGLLDSFELPEQADTSQDQTQAQPQAPPLLQQPQQQPAGDSDFLTFPESGFGELFRMFGGGSAPNSQKPLDNL